MYSWYEILYHIMSIVKIRNKAVKTHISRSGVRAPRKWVGKKKVAKEVEISRKLRPAGLKFEHRWGEVRWCKWGWNGWHWKHRTKSLFRPVFVVVIWPFSEQILNFLINKTIVKVRGGGGQRSMVKDHTFALLNFWTLPLLSFVSF